MREERGKRRKVKPGAREKRVKKPGGLRQDARASKKARKKPNVDSDPVLPQQTVALELALPPSQDLEEESHDSQPIFRTQSAIGPLSAPLSTSPKSSPVHMDVSQEPDPMREASDPRAMQVFESVSRQFQETLQHLEHKIAFFVVVHMVPTSIELLTGLASIVNARVAGVIYKSSVQHQETKAKIRALGFKQISIDKQCVDKKYLNDHPECIEAIVQRYLERNEKLMIVDIGGYFSRCLPYLNAIKKRVYGIVEDTTNGRQKYDAMLTTVKPLYPLMSVDRSELKRCEDYGVGESIVHLADTELRRHLKIRLTDQKYIVVIGYGRIGSSIAEHLRHKKVRNIIIYDGDPIKLALASANGFDVCVNKSTLYKMDINVIFGATGNKSLCAHDLRQFISKRIFVISCTSADDEFDLAGLPVGQLPPEYQGDMRAYQDLKKGGGHAAYRLYQFGTGGKVEREVFFMNEGNAINFSGHSVMGDGIRMVQAAIIAAGLKLVCARPPTGRIHTLLTAEERDIATQYLAAFEGQVLRITTNLPLKNPHYLKREGPMGQILKFFYSGNFRNTNKLILLSGSSGYGKSELAKAFAHANKDYYKLVWWVDLDSDYYEAFRQLARELGISAKGKKFSVLINEIGQRLVGASDFLIIFDGVTGLDKVTPILDHIKCMGQGRRHVICTSNDAGIKVAAFNYQADNILKVRVGRFEYSSELYADFNEHFPALLTEERFEQLVQALSGVPVRLMHCLRYLSHTKDLSFLPKTVCGDSGNQYKHFVKHMVCAMVAPKTTDMELLLCIALLPDWGLKKFYTGLEINGVGVKSFQLDKFVQFGFLVTNADHSAYFMHGKLRECLRGLYSQQIKKVIQFVFERLKTVFNYSFYRGVHDSADSLSFNQYLRYVENFLNFFETNNRGFKNDCYQLFYRLGSFYLHECRDYERSLYWYERASEIHSKGRAVCQDMAVDKLFSVSTEDRDVQFLQSVEALVIQAESTPTKRQGISQALQNADAKVTLAYVYKYKAELLIEDGQSPEPMLVAALQFLEQGFALLQPYSGDKMGALGRTQRLRGLMHHLRGGIYSLRGDLDSAAFEYNCARIMRLEVLGREHPTYARTLQKYAVVLFAQGNLEEAKAMCDEAFNIQSIHFVASHPNLEETEALRKQIDDAIYESMRPSLPAESQSQGLHGDSEDDTMGDVAMQLAPVLDADQAAAAAGNGQTGSKLGS